MVRKTDIRRDSEPRSHQLFGDEDQKAELEARNGLLQFDEVIRLVGEVEQGASFRLRPSTLSTLHRIAIQDIYSCAGNYRTSPVDIKGTDHQPPLWQDVPRLVEEMCDYVSLRPEALRNSSSLSTQSCIVTGFRSSAWSSANSMYRFTRPGR